MPSSWINLIKTEPALFSGLAQAVIALAIGLGVHLTSAQEGSLLAVTTAVIGLVAAIATRPFQVSALTALTGALVTLLVAYGVHGVQPSIVATLNAAIVAIAALIVRLHVTPVASLPKRPPAAA